MTFSTARLQQNGFYIIELKSDAGTSVQIIPSYGALLHAFEFMHKGQKTNLIDSYKNSDEMKAQVAGSFKSVKLSPFACRIKDAQYSWEQKDYTISKSPIHGLLYDQVFEIIAEEATPEYASVSLQHKYKGTDPGYPFAYTCDVLYRLLSGNALEVTTTITNEHTAPIPMMDGWHPYFSTGTPVDQLELQFHSKEIVEFNEQLIPTGKVLPYTAFSQAKSMEGVSLDNSFVLDFDQPSPLCTLHDPLKGISIEFYPEKSYPILQIYTPPHRKSIAVENLTGAPNAFNNGIGLVTIPAGQSARFSTTTKIKA
ncbi:aldose 1-epimerase [Chitinophaga niabensis]|uniref:aldose 1-epimerase n=1 Tax=Chitinophaga niabensis TaxID=536979 RepID=UPI0031BAFD49